MNLNNLVNVHKTTKGVIAQCPACLEMGLDQNSRNHLVLFPNNKFACVAFSGDINHKKRILQLLGGEVPDIGFAPKADLQVEKTYDKKLLLGLLPQYDLFLKRGISAETLKTFEVGLCHGGTLRYRLVAPIYNENGQIHGFWGRWFKEDSEGKSKYLLIGRKTNFTYPLHLNKPDILRTKRVVLIESCSDALYAWENGIRDIMVLFGITLSSKVLQFIVTNSLDVIIATNNEASGIGNAAAQKIYDKLIKYIDKEKVKIHLPPKKDLATLTPEELHDWYARI